MSKPFLRSICRVLGHSDERVQGPECGTVCGRCDEYPFPELDDPMAEVNFFRKNKMWADEGPDRDNPACGGCLNRVARRKVKEGKASIVPGNEKIFYE